MAPWILLVSLLLLAAACDDPKRVGILDAGTDASLVEPELDAGDDYDPYGPMVKPGKPDSAAAASDAGEVDSGQDAEADSDMSDGSSPELEDAGTDEPADATIDATVDATTDEPDAEPPPPPTCDGKPSGAREYRTRFLHATESYGSVCAGQQQTRLCEQGKWSDWTGSYLHETCSVDTTPPACEGKPSGSVEKRTRYYAPEVYKDGVCWSEEQKRTCTAGTWSGWSGTFAHDTCVKCNDQDGDYHGANCLSGADCDETNPSIYNGASELLWNQVDDNCDGLVGRHLEVVNKLRQSALYEYSLRFDGDYMFSMYQQLEVRRVDALDKRVLFDQGFYDSTQVDWNEQGVPQQTWQIQSGRIVAKKLYSGSGEYVSALLIFDARDRSKVPTLAYTLETPFYSRDFLLSGDGKRLYVRSEKTTLDVYDLGDPSAPKLLGKRALPCTFPQGQGDYVQVEDDGAGLLLTCDGKLWGTSDLAHVTTATFYPVTGTVATAGIAWFTDRSVISDASEIVYPQEYLVRYYELDWTNPTAPRAVQINTFNTLELSGQENFAAYPYLGTSLGLFFLSDRELCFRPRGDAPDRCVELRGAPSLLAVEGTRAFAGSGVELAAYDFAGGKVVEGKSRRSFFGDEVRIKNKLAYFYSGYGISVADVTNPSSENAVGALSMVIERPMYAGNTAYAYNYSRQGASLIRVIDLSDPTNLRHVGNLVKSVNMTLPTQTPVIRGSKAYAFSMWWGGLTISDLSDPLNPVPHDITSGEVSSEVQFRGDNTLVDDGEYIYSQSGSSSFSGLDVYRYDNQKLTLFNRIQYGAATKAQNGQAYAISGYSLLISDAVSGQRKWASAYHAGPQYIFVSGEDVFVTETWGPVQNQPRNSNKELYAYDPEREELVWAELPEQADGCLPMSGGEGYLLCSKGLTVFVLRATP